jgi:hypothetical protein
MSPAQYMPTAPPPIARLDGHPPIVSESAVIATEAAEGVPLIAHMAINHAARAMIGLIGLMTFRSCFAD